MRILFITASRLGDAILSTGLLSYIEDRWQDAEVTVACGPLAAPLFRAAPHVREILEIRKKSYHSHWLDLWKSTVPRRWDMVVDLRNSIVSRLVRGRQKYIFGPRIDRSLHKAEQNAAVMDLDHTPLLKLWFDSEIRARARDMIPDGGPVLGVGPASNWAGKTWPMDRFEELIARLTDASENGGILSQARVAVFAGPGEESKARSVLESIPRDKVIDMIGGTDILTAAATLERCNLFIGNDSGLTHAAAAVDTPCLALFGPTSAQHYKPWGPRASYIQTPESMEELLKGDGWKRGRRESLMTSLNTEDVYRAVCRFWAEQNNLAQI